MYLEKHGEVLKSATEPEFFGEPTSYFPDGQPASKYGRWYQTYENFKDFGYEEGEYDIHISEEKDWLNYLIDFRTIVESDMTTEEKLYQINDVMSQSSESHKDIYKKLVIKRQFPDSFFTNLLCELDGVGGKTAELLWDAGYLSIEAVENAPEEELLKIKGIGKSLVNKIKKNPISTKTNNFKKN